MVSGNLFRYQPGPGALFNKTGFLKAILRDGKVIESFDMSNSSYAGSAVWHEDIWVEVAHGSVCMFLGEYPYMATGNKVVLFLYGETLFCTNSTYMAKNFTPIICNTQQQK